MKIAYNTTELEKWHIIEDARKWHKAGIISDEEWKGISKEYYTTLYHPPFWLRVILFLATVLAIQSGVGYFMVLLLSDLGLDFVVVFRVLAGCVALGSFILLEHVVIANKLHYKSGVTEALLYMALGNLVMCVLGENQSEYVYALAAILSGGFAAVRYLNLVGVVVAVAGVAYIVFQGLYDLGGVFKHLIPFGYMVVFGVGYGISQKVQRTRSFPFYTDIFIVLDVVLLLLVYAGGNYYVVRELSIELMGLQIAEGEDIPLGWFFHITTVLIPVLYVYFGIRKKEMHLIRMGILSTFLSVITFKYYYSLNHPEITLTVAGAITAALAIWLLNYLKINRNGYTRNKLLSDKWDTINAESVVISSTMGGNVPHQKDESGFGGGKFGGGGAGGDF